MPLHAASYFAGVGTVVATIALGFGGGVLLTDAFVGKSERTPTLMERRAAPLSESTSAQTPEQQTAATTASAAPAPTSTPVATPQPQAAPPTVEQRPSDAVQAAAPAQPAAPTTAPQPAAGAVQRAPAPAQPSTPAPATDERARSEQNMGRAQDADLTNRDAEARKAGAERRKQERRKWAERRKRDMQRIDELTAVTEKVREAERGREREPVFRSFAAEPPTIRRSPVTTLFGDPED
jgi:hypothetical protein